MNPNPPTPEPSWPAGEPNQSPPNQTPPHPSWQSAPPAVLGQPHYGAPTHVPPGGAPYGQYIPASQPGQFPGQPNAPYAQPGQFPQPNPQPPYPGYQAPTYSPQRSNGQRNTMVAVGAGILVIAVIAFFALRGGGSSSLTGTWVGPVTGTVSNGSTQQGAFILTLNESSGGQVTGSAVSCDGSSTPSNWDITGTRSGSSVTLHFDSGVDYIGHLSGGQLTLTYRGTTDSGDTATATMNLHHGASSDFQAMCNALPSS